MKSAVANNLRYRGIQYLAAIHLIWLLPVTALSQDTHVWEKVEITLEAEGSYTNPYTDLDVWVQLKGPDFDKKVYGFWDGGKTFKVQVMATVPGSWSWDSYSEPADNGLNGKTGSFNAAEWTEEEKMINPNRRGIIRATENGHAWEYGDGTPFFLLGDTWWAASTWRYPWKGETPEPGYQPASGMGFEEGLSFLKSSGYNSIAIIASFPNWHDDGEGRTIQDNAGVPIRNAWAKPGGGATDMHDEDGNRPFVLPGKCQGMGDYCADYDQINPAYWQSLDTKYDYMWEQGFVPFMEAVRRDHGPSWKAYHTLNESYSRYLNYIAARYGVYNWVNSLLQCTCTTGTPHFIASSVSTPPVSSTCKQCERCLRFIISLIKASGPFRAMIRRSSPGIPI